MNSAVEELTNATAELQKANGRRSLSERRLSPSTPAPQIYRRCIVKGGTWKGKVHYCEVVDGANFCLHCKNMI